jgi:hypothetical protein
LGGGLHGNKYKLYLDLDGVLVNFEKGVLQWPRAGRSVRTLALEGCGPSWPRPRAIYANLEWMPDGRELWEYGQTYSPTVLTGLPLGKWAEPQKRQWCQRELGKGIPVICCMTRDKARVAFEDCEDGL